MTYQDLLSEFQLTEPKIVINNDKEFEFRQISFVTIPLKEEGIRACSYQDSKGQQIGDERIKAIRPALNGLAKKIEEDPSSMQLLAYATKDDRLAHIHVFVDSKARTLQFNTYTSYVNIEDYKNDMSFLKEVKQYIQRKTELYNYSLQSVDTFGVIYYVKKIESKD